MRGRIFVLFLLVGLVSAQRCPRNAGSIDIATSNTGGFDGKPAGNAECNTGAASGILISVSDLAIPARARKEFAKAYELSSKRAFPQALERLKRAVSIYPAYAGAYNNMAVVYERLGDLVEEREALEKAVSLDDHFALAYLNLGRADIQAGNFADAEKALHKADGLAPADATSLILLAHAQLMQKHFDAAIETSQRAHRLSKFHSLAHRLAARAFEQKRQFAHAIGELRTFLEEEPAGPAADSARKELEIVESVLAGSQSSTALSVTRELDAGR
ncbi:MAG TPA: tetratricopeptide repeat protein [Candidatus Acidoferrales bacterium]|nr:tetratricopeptide repeat protein [Candidatus Acidoferrales bacterium]